MLTNILIWTGVILIALAILFVIRFDGSIKRVVICGIMALIGLVCLLVGNGRKNLKPIEYKVKEITAINTSGDKFRVVLAAGGDSTVIYVDSEEIKNFEEGSKISLTKIQLDSYND